jgi:hypothetical protein
LLKYIYIFFLAAFGSVVGAVVGFIAAIFVNPEASPSYVFWGGIAGTLGLLYTFGCIGTLIKGFFLALAGAVAGYAAGWGVSLAWSGSGFQLPYWGAWMGAVAFACWPPRMFRSAAELAPLRGKNAAREAERARAGYTLPAASGSLPAPPPYRSDGVRIGIQQVQQELNRLAPGVDFGISHGIARDTSFFAADLDYLRGPFFDYVASRMRAEGITGWLDSKFDCDDFAYYLGQCATMCLHHSGLSKATHSILVSTVQIAKGASLLNVGGAENAFHANNLVRCTDGNWYFIEPQEALHGAAAPRNILLQAILSSRGKNTALLRGLGSQIAAGDWICPVRSALSGRGVTLLHARLL